MKNIFARNINFNECLKEVKPGKVYILFVADNEVAMAIREYMDKWVEGMNPPPKILVLPVEEAKPRILYFE